MTTATQPSRATQLSAADQALFELGRHLQQAAYSFTAITPLSHQYNNQRAAAAHAQNLRDIFGWSRPFARSVINDQLFELMQAAQVLQRDGDRWRSKVRFADFRGLLCAHSAYPTDASDAVFFGPDTYRFGRLIASHLQGNERRTHRAVDIGCGTGAGAMLVARAYPGAQVYALDINPQALRMSSVNARLAGCENVTPVHSNLLREVSGQFDLIVANPPYMLDSQERAYRHGGGALGAGLSEQIVNAALARLTPGGTLLLYTGVAMVEGHDPFLHLLQQRLQAYPCRWHYQEIDPDVFGEELLKPGYQQVERIAAVELVLTLPE